MKLHENSVAFEADIQTKSGDIIYVSNDDAYIVYKNLDITDVYSEDDYFDSDLEIRNYEYHLRPDDVLEELAQRMNKRDWHLMELELSPEEIDDVDKFYQYVEEHLAQLLDEHGQEVIDYFREYAEDEAREKYQDGTLNEDFEQLEEVKDLDTINLVCDYAKELEIPFEKAAETRLDFQYDKKLFTDLIAFCEKHDFYTADFDCDGPYQLFVLEKEDGRKIFLISDEETISITTDVKSLADFEIE